jgi:hypothetical protein
MPQPNKPNPNKQPQNQPNKQNQPKQPQNQPKQSQGQQNQPQSNRSAGQGQPQANRSANQQNAFQQELQKIQQEIQALLVQMKKNQNYTPNRSDVEKIGSKMVSVLKQYQPTVNATQNTLLKEAVVDLTEIPVMQASAQRVSIQTALTDASQCLKEYLAAA